MPKAKKKVPMLKGVPDNYDFTFNPIGMANIRFNAAMVAEIILDAENMEFYIRVTNEVAEKSYTGTASLTEEV